MRVELQPAYILHTRPFRDTSLLLDCFSKSYGRMTLVAKGARSPKQRQRHLLQPFIPLLLSWQGKSDLKTLIAVESHGAAFDLKNNYLYSGFYINELLIYLLAQHDVATDIYEIYEQLLSELNQQGDLEVSLRIFEFSFLSLLGYEIDFKCEGVEGKAIAPHHYYAFINEVGFVLVDDCPDNKPSNYSGEQLLLIAQNNYEDPLTRKVAKHIARTALSFHLQGREIKSRVLFSGGNVIGG